VFDCKVARHGNMIVGKTGSGKTEAWKCLTRALARLKKDEPDDERFQKASTRGRSAEKDLCQGGD
jgi:dynein heavy chain